MYVHHFKYFRNLPFLGSGVMAVNQEGFFDGFSTPSFVAHLAIEKEQSREFNQDLIQLGISGRQSRGITGSKKRLSNELIPKSGQAMTIADCLLMLPCSNRYTQYSHKQKAAGMSPYRPILIWISPGGNVLFYFPNTSIKQFLTVLAMSTLTTSDLKNFDKNWTYVYDHQSDRKVERAKANSN